MRVVLILFSFIIFFSLEVFACNAEEVLAAEKGLSKATELYSVGELQKIDVLAAELKVQTLKVCLEFVESKMKCLDFRAQQEKKLTQAKEYLDIGEISYGTYKEELMRTVAAVELCSNGQN